MIFAHPSYLIAFVSLVGLPFSDAASSGVLTEADKQELLDLHNKQRRDTALGNTGSQPMATDMIKLVWDEDIAVGAASYASNCIFEHDTSGYGENLAAKASTSDNIDNIAKLLEGVEGWYDEHEEYTYSSGACSGVCGHYTQNVWASSKKLGCGYSRCSEDIFDSGWPYETMLVCRYDPPGNWVGQKPYTKAETSGDVASGCPTGYTAEASTGLCVDGSVTTPAPVASPGDTPAPVASPGDSPAPSESPSCSDTTLRFKIIKNGIKKTRGCGWVATKAENRCALDGASETCRVSCGECDSCADSTLRLKILKPNGKKIHRSCDWVATKSGNRCTFDGVSSACSLTCGLCSS